MAKPFAPKLVTNLFASLSIGVAVYPDNGLDSEELTIHADLAMYNHKELHRGKRRCVGREKIALAWLSL